jgi:glc operon protein GlcG
VPDNDVVPMSAVSLGAARRIADAALAKAHDLGLTVCIAITDPSGEPVVTLRMDGAPRLCSEVALNKAYSVANFNGMPTDRWWSILKDDPALVAGFPETSRLVIFAGGVPVVVDGQVVGAVGVSGGSSDEDRQIAQAGADVVA